MLSKDFVKSNRIFYTNRYMVIYLLLLVILILPFKSNAQLMPGLVEYGLFGSQMQKPAVFGLGVNTMQGLLGYGSFVNPLQSLSGFGFGTSLMLNPLGYGLLGSQMQYPMGFNLGVSPVIEAITNNELISDDRLITKIEDLDSGKTAQISKSDKINGYYEYIVISDDIALLPIYNYPCLVDTNDVIIVVECLLDENKFVFIAKAEKMSNKIRVGYNDISYYSTSYSTSPITTSYGGIYPTGTFYGDLSWLGGSGSIDLDYLNPLVYSGIGGLLGNINGSSAMQYMDQRINEAYLLPNLYSTFTGSIYGNPMLSIILGNTPLYGRPTIIQSEISGKGLTLSGDPLRNCHFNLLDPGLSFSMNLITNPFQFFPSPLF